MISHIQAEL